MAERMLRSTWWEAARLKRQVMRDKARQHLLERGFCQLTAGRLNRGVGGNNIQNRYRYPDLSALLADVVRRHQDKLVDSITEAVLAARPLTGCARLEAFAAGLLEALSAERDGCICATMILTALPAIAEQRRHHDCWLHGVLAETIDGTEDERAMLARSMLTLIADWSLRLDASDTETRAHCARLLARMMGAARA